MLSQSDPLGSAPPKQLPCWGLRRTK